jgi:aminoglycoside 2''-phosphotransferase
MQWLKEIKLQFPQLKWTKSEQIKLGMDHVVFMLDKKVIFRFPKDEAYRKTFKDEVALMKLLNRKLTSKVPVYKYLDKKQTFGGYDLIPGKDLDRNKNALTKNYRKIAKGVADFLSELHGIKPAEFGNIKIGNRLVLNEYARFKKEVVKYLYPKLNSKDKVLVQDFFHRLSLVLKQKTPKVLVHGDLSFDHILLKSDLKSVVGIIDFSDRSISDTARDFTFFWDNPKFLYEVYKNYKFKDTTLLERSKIYFQGSALWEAVLAVKNKKPFAKYLSMYRKRLNLD